MQNYRKYCAKGLLWVLLSEILCLVLAISFAILRPAWLRYVSLICGVTAHCLLMGNCARDSARADAADYRRTGQRAGQAAPLLAALTLAVPAWVTYLLLCLNPDSVLMLNLYPLLNAPFLQLHRLLSGGLEPFSAIPLLRRLLMALPPLVTAAAWWVGYQTGYIPALAKQDASHPRT